MTAQRRIQKFTRGQPLVELRQPLNRLVAELNRRDLAPGGPVNLDLPPFFDFTVEIKAFGIGPEFTMTCVLPGQGANVDAQEWTVHPPFTFVVTSRDGVSYTYTDLNNRTADGTDDHEMTPKYLVGDKLAVMYDITNNRFYDTNIDGRMWAKV